MDGRRAAQMPSEESGECNVAAPAPLVVISRNDWARKWDWAVNGDDQTSPSNSIYPARLSELSRSVLGNGKKFYYSNASRAKFPRGT